mmetsp:Transcript_10418/g.23141  ORF Transcript_10418/g.23141 Transcript_10418/m.23141 type:complete len:90 (-) Transcript_10418:71-340(-)
MGLKSASSLNRNIPTTMFSNIFSDDVNMDISWLVTTQNRILKHKATTSRMTQLLRTLNRPATSGGGGPSIGGPMPPRMGITMIPGQPYC